MYLPVKDLTATLIAAVIAVFSLLVINELSLPFISGYRSATLFLLLAGITMCGINGAGSNMMSMSEPCTSMLAGLGFAALIFGVAGVIAGTKLLFILLAATILLLWFMATVQHMVTTRPYVK